MLWDLYGVKAGQLYRSWNTSVKVAWDVPRATHTYLVDNLLSCGLLNVKQQLVSRFVKFFRNLLKSHSPEVKVVANRWRPRWTLGEKRLGRSGNLSNFKMCQTGKAGGCSTWPSSSGQSRRWRPGVSQLKRLRG